MSGNEPVRVLQVLNHMDYGGIEAVVINYYKFINRNRVQFDFAVSEDSIFPQRKELESMGAHIYLLPKVSSLFSYVRTLKRIIREHGYHIVHCHMNTLSVVPLFAAWLGKVPTRICHNHTTAHLSEGKRSILKYILRPFNKLFATDYFACSEYAGKWMYGKEACRKNKVYIMPNAINTNKYQYDEKAREETRERLQLNNNLVIGHVGRFMYQKNHNFLIEIFNEIYKKNKNARLLLVGEGDLEQEIKNKVNGMGLKNVVIFYGTCDNMAALYQAMDVFCLPSYYEGLPVVAVEAQASGLPVVASDVITEEIALSNHYRRLSLEDKLDIWVENIQDSIVNEEQRRKGQYITEVAGFSIYRNAVVLTQYYLNRI